MKKECVVKFLEICKEKTCGEISSLRCGINRRKEKLEEFTKYIDYVKSLSKKEVTIDNKIDFYKCIQKRKEVSADIRLKKVQIKELDKTISTIDYAIKCLNEVKE